uniref:DUF1320 domain-containing protein n=1 Tax=viral metagenome TaxID=1070528 RepID=A0A6M3J8H6_9ZZZZ
MAYCTQADLEDRVSEDELIQMTDDDDTGSVDATRVTNAIADADAEIDSYCAGRYSVPFATVPRIVRKFAVDMAVYHLASRRRGVTEDQQERYRRAIRFFEDVSKGNVDLGVQPPPDPPADDYYSGESQVSVRTKDFDSTTMGKY